ARAADMVAEPGLAAPVGALDWGFSGATFCVVSGGQVHFTRYLRKCGIGPLARQVSEALGLSFSEGERLLITHGIPHSTAKNEELRDVQEVILEVGVEILAELVEQVQRTLSYLQARHRGLVPQHLWLFGGGATIKNMADFLFAKVGVPVRLWRLTEHDDENHGRPEHSYETKRPSHRTSLPVPEPGSGAGPNAPRDVSVRLP
ncbi:MAG: hypothetical protein IH908_12680, partial [Proteobacteria bacterium]|nr:hypothetical protein [Pseudomonadota bacterium]